MQQLTAAITDATNASPIVITSAGHSLATGYRVTITGVLGNTAANGTFTVTSVNGDKFSLDGSTGNGAYTSGGTWIHVGGSITGATNAAPIVVTSTAHKLVSGDLVVVSSVGGNTAANGTFTIEVVDGNSFNLNESDGNASYTSGGTWTFIDASDDSNTAIQYSIKHETTIEGQGDVTLGDVVTGFLPYSKLPDGSYVQYHIEELDGGGDPTGVFETGLGTYDATANSISRDVVIQTDQMDFEDDLTITRVDFGAGNKHISSLIDVETEDQTKNEIIVASAAFLRNSEPVCTGMLVSASGIPSTGTVGGLIERDADRQCRDTNVLMLAPVSGTERNEEETGFIRLLCVSQSAGSSSQISAYRDFRISEVRRNSSNRVVRSDFYGLRLNSASPIPFRYDADKIREQATTEQWIPFDVFCYAGITNNSSPDPIGQIGSITAARDGLFYTSTFAPRLFYLNWHSQASRNNGNEGSPMGFEIVQNGNWVYLDTQSESGWPSDWITDNRFGYKAAKRYLYLGTCFGRSNGTATCCPGLRGIWNQWKKIRYQDQKVDNAPFWDIGSVRQGAWYQMHFQAMQELTAPWDRPWTHYWINPRGQLSAKAVLSRFQLTFNGNLVVRGSYYNPSTRGYSNMVSMANPSVELTTPNRADRLYGRTDVDSRNFVAPEVSGQPIKGLIVYQAGYALGTSDLSQFHTTRRFYGNNQRFVLGDPTVVFPGHDPGNAGPAVFTVEGEC